MLTDSHCHLADNTLYDRLPEIIAAARAAGVGRFIVPSVTPADFDTVCRLHVPPEYYGAIGIHPWHSETFHHDLLSHMASKLQAYPKLLVGEIGLDYHGLRKQSRTIQIAAFTSQVELAQQHCRPIVLHNVRATADLVATLKRIRFRYGGLVHAFSGSLEEARVLTGFGLLIGIGTLVLNPNARKVRTAAAALPLNCLALETDSPFMRPHGHNENTPANVRLVAETVARLRGTSRQEVAAATERNINRLLCF